MTLSQTIEERLARIEALLGERCDSRHDSLAETVERLEKTLDRFGQRIGTLERWMWFCIGGGFVIGGAVGLLIPILARAAQ